MGKGEFDLKKYLLTMAGTEYGVSRHNLEGIYRDYDAEADRLEESTKKWDLEFVRLNNDFILNWEHYNEYRETLTKTGFGFAFKPIGYWETLKKMDYGDVAIFVDSNHVVAKDPTIYYEIANQYDIFAQDHIWTYYPNRDWTHRDTFINMRCDEEKYWNAPQLQCNLTGIKKSPRGLQFAKEYLDCCLDWRITFGEGKHPDFDTYKENRHNQSCFSILVVKYEIPYLNRTENVGMEYIIPEMPFINATNPVDNSYRKERDKKDIR